MNTNVGAPVIGQWYARTDKGEEFQVVGRDEESRTIEIQTVDGDVDEIDAEEWAILPLEAREPPEDSAAPMDDVEHDDLDPDADMTSAQWVQPLQELPAEGESWEDTAPEDERDALGEGTPEEPYSEDVPEARDRAG